MKLEEKGYDIYVYVPGKEWLWTHTNDTALTGAKLSAKDFVIKHGEDKWTTVRIYPTKARVEGVKGEITWYIN